MKKSSYNRKQNDISSSARKMLANIRKTRSIHEKDAVIFYDEKMYEKINIDILDSFLVKIVVDRRIKNKTICEKIFLVQCNFFDIFKFLKKFNVSIIKNFNENDNLTYSATSLCYPKRINTCFIMKKSMYGDSRVNLNIKGYLIGMIVSTKSHVFKQGYNLYNGQIDLNKLVIFDIETTGLVELIDDIIEITFYDAKNNLCYSRRLPLQKRNDISTNISKLNHITKDALKEAKNFNQSEINELIKRFDLKNKIIGFWSGQNLFDPTF